MNRPRDYRIKWNVGQRKNMLYDIPYMWPLQNKTNESTNGF